MGLRDRAVKALRELFGSERDERESAESPSTLASMNKPTSSIYSDSKYGQFAGLLTISNRLIDRYLDYECLTADTQVLTLAGPVSIKTLADRCSSDPDYRIPLYTWDGEKITVGHGQDARRVKRAKVYRVLLDDGVAIRATGNHRFMRRDGTYAETLELKPGDSLMPLYLSKDAYGNRMYTENNEYHKGALCQADSWRTRRVSRMVAEWMMGGRMTPGIRVRHIGDKLDDSPDNLDIRDEPGLREYKVVRPLVKALREAQYVIKENCVAEGQLVLAIDGSIVTPMPIEQLVSAHEGQHIVAFDVNESALKTVEAQAPRMTSNKAEVMAAQLSNGQSLRLTSDHRCLTVDRGYVALKDLRRGDKLWSMFPGHPLTTQSVLTSPNPGEVSLLTDPIADGIARVFDITTDTHNFIVSGVVVHNSVLSGPPLRHNHKVVEILELDEQDVYCLDVPGTHNYAVGNESGGVFTHNSMSEYPDINAAIHYFSNDATQPNIDNDRTIWVESSDHVIKGVANTLLRKKLRLDDEMFSIAYSLVKYGNNFEELLVTDNGVVGMNFLPPATARRIEHENGALVGFIQDPTGQFTDSMDNLRAMLAGDSKIPPSVALFEDWQVLHMRLRAEHRRSPYGFSTFDGARWIWKRLVMLEDATLIYKLTRAPSRFAFYIDVTDQPARKINGILRQAKSQLKKRQIVDPRSGKLALQFNPLASDEDFFLPVRDGKELARVENLQGPEYQSMEPVEYFQRKLHGVLKVPREYLGQDGSVPGRAILSNEDVRAARVTLNIQKELRCQIEKLIRIDAAARGYGDPKNMPFEVRMTMPSGIYALTQYEVKNSQADFASRVEPFVSKDWIRRNVFKFSDDEIKAIEKGADRDMQAGGGGFGGFGADVETDLTRFLGETIAEKHRGVIPTKHEIVKMIDQFKRTEERRYRMSEKRHDQILEKLDHVIRTNHAFAGRLKDRIEFSRLVRDNGISHRNGYAHPVTTGRPLPIGSRKPNRG